MTAARTPSLALLTALVRSGLAAGGWRVVGLFILMMASSVTSGAALIALVPLIRSTGVALPGGDGDVGWLSLAFSDAAGSMGLPLALAIFVGLTMCQAGLGWWQGVATADVTQQVAATLRRRTFDAVLDADWIRLSKRRSSDLLETLIRGVERSSLAMHDLLTLTASATFAIVYIGLALAISVPATIVACAAGGLLSGLLASRRAAAFALGEVVTTADRELHRVLGDTLSSLKLIRTSGRESRHRAWLDQAAQSQRRAHIGLASHPALVRAWFDVGAAVALSVVVIVAVRLLGVSAAGLLVLMLLFFRLLPRVSSVQVSYQALLTELPAYAAVRAVVDECRQEEAGAGVHQETVVPPLSQAVSLERVTFGYGDASVLRGVTLQIPAGTTVALVGPSGAGKTTVADLVLGLVRPSSGSVRIDGVELTPDRVRSWRTQVAYVPQDGFLFHESIRANLLWSAPQATEADLWAALETASAADFVRQLPQGLDTPVGDRGDRLSGGERQRLALARALVRKPRFLVLDEATSALDGENERRVQQALEALRGRMTLLVIAHRPSTIRMADAVAVLEAGRIVRERGATQWQMTVAVPPG